MGRSGSGAPSGASRAPTRSRVRVAAVESRPIRGSCCMHFHMHLLATYFPDRDPPFDRFYQQILDQIQLAEELGWECFWFTEHHFQVYGGPVPNPAVMMSAAAARTSKIHLGCAVSVLP